MRILSRSSRRSARRKGLTLIEVLISSVIFAILATSLFVVFKAGLDSWRKTQGHLEVYQNARAALDIMTRELSAAYLNPSNSAITFRGFFGPMGRSGWVTPSGADEVFFIAAMNPSLNYANATSDLCKVGYYLDNTTNQLMRYSHYVKAGDAPDYDFSHNAPSDNVSFRKVASNITGFSLRYSDSTGSPTNLKWDSTSASAPAQYGKKPVRVEITLTVKEPNSSKTQDFIAGVCIPQ